MATVGKLNVILSANVRQFMSRLEASQERLNQVKERMNAVAGAATKMAAAFGAAGAATATVAGRFEKEMTRVAAVATGSRDRFDGAFKQMSGRALELAGDTEFTARQVAEGMGFMAMAGMKVHEVMGASAAVTDLASAAAIDLGRSADIVTNVMAGLGKKTEDLNDVNNVLVATFTGSNVTLSELGEAFKTAGPVAKLYGIEIESVAAALGLLGNAGIKGSEAGTGLKRAFTAFSKDSPKVKRAFKTLGISADDLTSPDGGIGLVISKLAGTEQAFKDAGKTAEFTGILFEAFGERAGPKMAALIGQPLHKFEELRQKAKKAKAENLTDFIKTKQVETFIGQFNILISAMERFAIVVGREVIKELKPLIQYLQDVFKNLSNLSPETIKSWVTFGKWAIGIALGTAAMAKMIAVVTGVASGIGTLSAAATAAGATFGGLTLGPLAALAAGFFAFKAALSVVESAIGKEIDVVNELKTAFMFATESSGNFKNTLLDLGRAALSVMTPLGFLNDFNFGWTDAVKDAETLTGQAKQVFAAQEEIKKNLERAGTTEALIKVGEISAGGGVVVPQYGVDEEMLAWHESLEGVTKLANQLNANLKKHANDRRRALESESKVRQDALNEQRAEAKRLADELAEEQRRAKEAEDAKAAAAKKAAERLAKQAENAKAVADAHAKIADMEQSAARKRALAMAGDNSSILQEAFNLEDAQAGLEEAFRKAGVPMMEMGPIMADFRAAFLENVASFVEGKRGSEDFGEALEFAKKVAGKFGMKLREVTDQIEGQGVVTGIAPIDLDDRFSKELRSLASSAIQLGRKLAEAGVYVDEQSDIITREMARRIASADSLDKVNLIMSELEEVAGALGIEFDKLTKAVKKERANRSFSDVKATTGKDPTELLSEGMFDAMRGAMPDEDLKAMTNNASDALVKGFSGQSFLAPVGGAIGAAFGNPAIGAAIGGGISGILESLTSGITDIVVGLMPDERLGAAAKMAMGALFALSAAINMAIGVALIALSQFIIPLLLLAAALGPITIAITALTAIALAVVAAIGLLVSFIVGFVAGPWALLAAAVLGVVGLFFLLGGLVTQTEAFADMMKAMQAAVGEIVDALGKNIRGSLLAFAGLFSTFIAVIGQMVIVFSGGFNSLSDVLFNVLKALAVAFVDFVIFMAHVQNNLIPIFTVLLQVVGRVSQALAFFAHASLLGAKAAFWMAKVTGQLFNDQEMAEAAQDGINSMESLGGAIDALNTGILDVADALSDFTVGDEVFSGLEGVRNSLVQLTKEGAIAEAERLLATEEQTEKMKELNDQLTNVPQAFKVNLERWRAVTGATGLGRGAGGIVDEPAGGSIWNVDQMVIELIGDSSGSLLDQLEREVQDRAARGAGNPYVTGSEYDRSGR